MHRPNIAACGLDKYANLLTGLFEKTGGLAICDSNGIPLWTHDAAGGRSMAETAASLIGRPSTASKEKPFHSHRLSESRSLYELTVFDDENSRLGSLMMIPVNDGGLDNALLRESLESVAACIRDECQLNKELDSMALELTERYEELNLLYDTDDQVSYFREGQDALEQLVKNCADYLDVDLALLRLPEKGIELQHKSGSGPSSEHAFLHSDADTKLYRMGRRAPRGRRHQYGIGPQWHRPARRGTVQSRGLPGVRGRCSRWRADHRQSRP